MKKQFISKILAVTIAFSFIGIATEANASTISSQNNVATYLQESEEPLTLVSVDFDSDNKVNKEFYAAIRTKGGKGTFDYHCLVLKDGEKVYESHSEYESFFWVPREAGNYTLVVEVRTSYGGKAITTRDINVADSDSMVTTPTNLKYTYVDNKTIRLSWDESTAVNCKFGLYYLMIDGGARRTPNTYYDFTLDDSIHYAYVKGVNDGGRNTIWSLDSKTIIIPRL